MKIHNTILPSKVKPKYKDVELVPLSDASYQIRCKELFNQRLKSKLEKITQSLPRPATDLISKPIEKLFQNKFQSAINRILAFSVHYEATYQKQFRELDIVRIEKDGSLTIGEIKVTNNYKSAYKKAVDQISHSVEILSVAYSKITSIIIIVDLSKDEKTNNSPIEKTSINGFQYMLFNYTYFHIKQFVQNQWFDMKLLEKAHFEAKESALSRIAKAEAKLQRIIEAENEKISTISDFGFLLQHTLKAQTQLT